MHFEPRQGRSKKYEQMLTSGSVLVQKSHLDVRFGILSALAWLLHPAGWLSAAHSFVSWFSFGSQLATDVQISESLPFLLNDVWSSLFVMTVTNDAECKLVKRVGCIGYDRRMERNKRKTANR